MPYTLYLIPHTRYIPKTLYLIPTRCFQMSPRCLPVSPCCFSYGFFKVSSPPGGQSPFAAGHRPAVPDCVFTVLGEGRARLVHAKWSVAPLPIVKHNGFVTFLLPRPPGASWVPLVPPGCLLGASWLPPGCLLGASWVPPGCFLGASWEHLLGACACWVPAG